MEEPLPLTDYQPFTANSMISIKKKEIPKEDIPNVIFGDPIDKAVESFKGTMEDKGLLEKPQEEKKNN